MLDPPQTLSVLFTPMLYNTERYHSGFQTLILSEQGVQTPDDLMYIVFSKNT